MCSAGTFVTDVEPIKDDVLIAIGQNNEKWSNISDIEHKVEEQPKDTYIFYIEKNYKNERKLIERNIVKAIMAEKKNNKVITSLSKLKRRYNSR